MRESMPGAQKPETEPVEQPSDTPPKARAQRRQTVVAGLPNTKGRARRAAYRAAERELGG